MSADTVGKGGARPHGDHRDVAANVDGGVVEHEVLDIDEGIVAVARAGATVVDAVLVRSDLDDTELVEVSK